MNDKEELLYKRGNAKKRIEEPGREERGNKGKYKNTKQGNTEDKKEWQGRNKKIEGSAQGINKTEWNRRDKESRRIR